MTIAMRRAEGAEDVPDPLAVVCYRRPWRAVVALLVVASRASLPLILARVVYGQDPPATLPLLIGLVATMVLVPGGLAAFLQRAFAARMMVEGDTVVVTRRDMRLEIPASAIVAVVPWRLPLPTPGAALLLRSGRRLGYEIGLTTPSRLVTLLADRAGTTARTVRDDPALLHADAARHAGALRWWQWLVKFPLLGLLPTAVLFNAHQWIAYGGTLGEYYTYGAIAYLLTFLDYWTTVTIYLALWAGLWRGTAEIMVWGAARRAPASILGVRRFVEIGCRVLYYGGVPALLALRFMP
jgi:apolipoprotein N-acyltransferase